MLHKRAALNLTLSLSSAQRLVPAAHYFRECHNLQGYRKCVLVSSVSDFPGTTFVGFLAVPAARCTLPLIIVLRLNASDGSFIHEY